VPPEVFTRVPEPDVYALVQVAISPELGGLGGIAGITAEPYAGSGQQYPDEEANLADALAGSLGEAGTLALAALAAAILAAAIATSRRHATATQPAPGG
jgi:hypothetical protein